MTWFPTEEWLTEYRGRLNDDDEFAEKAEEWGDGWNGDFVFHIRDMPLDENRVTDLPDELVELRRVDDGIWDGVPEDIRDQILEQMGERPVYEVFDLLSDDIREALPDETRQVLEDAEEFYEENPTFDEAPEVMSDRMREVLPSEVDNLLRQMKEHVNDGDVYAFVGVEEGECTDVEVLDSADERSAGFVLRGDYEEWKNLIEGMDVVQGVMSGNLELDGDLNRILEHVDASQRMAEVSSEVETEYIL